jgi:nitrogen regulatory protein PII
MQLITAIIQPFMMERLARQLRKQKVTGYTVTPVSGSGRDLANTPEYLQPRIKVEIAVNDETVDTICALITNAVNTHQDGDGILFVTPITHAINLQTLAVGANALTID